MSRTPKNRTDITITDTNSVSNYISKFSGMMGIAMVGGYCKQINDGGWVAPQGSFEVSNQGLIKTVVWAVAIMAGRAEQGDEEAKNIVGNISNFVQKATDHKIHNLSAVIKEKIEGEAPHIQNVDNAHVH